MRPMTYIKCARRASVIICMVGWSLVLAQEPSRAPTPDDSRSSINSDGHSDHLFRTLCSLEWASDDDLTAAMFSPDGASVLTGACDVDHSAGMDPPSDLEEALSPRVTISGRSPEVILWDAVTGKNLRVFKDHRAPVRTLAFDPNGRYIASGGAEDYFPDHSLPAPKNNITRRYSGRDLTAHPEGGIVKLWDVATAREVYSFIVPGEGVGALAFSPDGDLLVLQQHLFYAGATHLGASTCIAHLPRSAGRVASRR
jgi:hypothetical protein